MSDRKRTTKYITIFFLCCFMLMKEVLPVRAASTSKQTRQINVVYDDSGSMAYDDGKYVTRWSEAKYALEVFAAMMGETDNMTIYPMSSFSYTDDKKSETWGKKYSLKGTQNVTNRIQTINEMNGSNGVYMNTPIETVTKAGKALSKSDANEKWLVILTDGEFDDGTGKKIGDKKAKDTILKYTKLDDEINVAYIPIGDSAKTIESSSDNYVTVSKKDNILDQVKKVAKSVFNYQSISLSNQDSTFSITPDIPVSKFIIFAQGKDVTIDDLIYGDEQVSGEMLSADVEVSKNTEYKPSTETHSSDKMKTASGLKGQVVTYQSKDENHPFAAGQYSFNCNVDNIEIFFEPGVSIEAFITDTNGQEINLNDDSVSEIDAGKKALNVKVVNPLTGEEIDPDSSELLQGVQLSMILTDQDGKKQEYQNGDTVDIPEGEVSIYARARFSGDIEKTSNEKKLKVNQAQLLVSFVESEGYVLDPVNLDETEDIFFQVNAADGTEFSEAEYEKTEIKVDCDIDAIEWKSSYIGEGKYQLIPKIKENKNLSDFDTDPQNLSVSVTISSGKIQRSGTGSSMIAIMASDNVKLILSLNMPESKVTDSKGRQYMFDASERKVEESAPYILVDVKIEGENGKTRSLTEEEWKKGRKGFSFEGKQTEASILYKIIKVVCNQKLDFDVQLGEQVSTYKLYLTGITPAGVLTQTSDLTVSLNIKLKNGIEEKGSAVGQVTVKAVGWYVYLGRLLLILIITVLIIIILIMEIKKPRLPKEMEPNSMAYLERAGVPIKSPSGPQFSRKKKKYVFWPPWRPEEKKVTMKYPQYLTPITFNCVATGNGKFKIERLDKKFVTVKTRVTFDGRSYDDVTLTKQPAEFNANSSITVHVMLGNVKGDVVLRFQKNK